MPSLSVIRSLSSTRLLIVPDAAKLTKYWCSILMALWFPFSVALRLEASSKWSPWTGIAATEWAGGDCLWPASWMGREGCMACGAATGMWATAGGEAWLAMEIPWLAWVELVDLAVITGGDWNALALETDPGLAVALAVVGVEAAAEGGAFLVSHHDLAQNSWSWNCRHSLSYPCHCLGSFFLLIIITGIKIFILNPWSFICHTAVMRDCRSFLGGLFFWWHGGGCCVEWFCEKVIFCSFDKCLRRSDYATAVFTQILYCKSFLSYYTDCRMDVVQSLCLKNCFARILQT